MNRQPIPKDMREQVLARDGYRCRYCGKQSQRFHMDHVYPISLGGETTIDNLVTACPRCNIKKSNSVGVWPVPLHIIGIRTRANKTINRHVLFFLIMASLASFALMVSVEKSVVITVVSLSALWIGLLLAIGFFTAQNKLNKEKPEWYD